MTSRIAKHKAVIAMCTASLAFVAGGFAWALAALGGRGGASGAAPLILHFNDIAGITQIGTSAEIAYAGIFAAVAVVMNCAIAFELDARDRVFGKLVAGATLALAVLLFIACAAIINVNV